MSWVVIVGVIYISFNTKQSPIQLWVGVISVLQALLALEMLTRQGARGYATLIRDQLLPSSTEHTEPKDFNVRLNDNVVTFVYLDRG